MSRPARRVLVAAVAASMVGAIVSVPAVVSSSPAAAATVTAPFVAHASGSASWSVLRNPVSPLAPSEDSLTSVSCTSGVHCMAVGSGYNTALAEKWNGSRWLIVPTPAPRGRVLQSVSCPTAKSCTAVGFAANDPNGLRATTLVESWNGAHWSVVPTPNRVRPLSLLEGVSCTTATNCIAVGYEGDGVNLVPLAERWDGARWSVMSAIAPTGSFEAGLFAVTCISYQNCIATGANTSRNSTVPLSEHWDGRAWSIVPMPAPPGADESFLNGVSCVSPISCQAVGVAFEDSLEAFSESTLAEHWNGSKWSIVATPNVPGGAGSFFEQVSCKTPSNCIAVGGVESTSFTNDAPEKPLTAHWNGRAWSRVPSASQPGLLQSLLSGVSCPGVNNCAAVGASSTRTSANEAPHAERWNGSKWSVVPTQHRPGPHIAVLSAVSCVATGQCRAVGQSAAGVLVERWNGRNWAIMKPAATPGRFGRLSGISCVTASACMAVGSAVGVRDAVPLAERWDGRHWTRIPMPAPIGKTDSLLSSVSCPRANNCTAVGTAYDFGASFESGVLAEHWNGKKWTIVHVPGPSGAQSPQLTSVSCSAPDNCVAVGSYYTQGGTRALIRRWNGKKWSAVASPAPAGVFGVQLSGVSCPAAGNCTAVGAVFSTTGIRAFVEQSNGNTWSEAASPVVSNRNTLSTLSAVSCASARSCTAIGSVQRFSPTDFTANPAGGVLIERWDGTSWTVIPSPDVPDSLGAFLAGVSCRHANACIGVGYAIRSGNGAQQALAEGLN